MKNISVLGSTGSIGTQTLDIVSKNSDLNVVAMAAYGSIELLEKQVRQFKPELVCVYDEEKALELRQSIRDMNIRVVSGMDGLIETAVIESAEIVVTAIVGMIGLQPTMAAIKAGKDIALANKETLVTAGHIIIPVVTSVSLLAKAISFPAFIAAIVGCKPIIPTIAVTTILALSMHAASIRPSIPDTTRTSISDMFSINSSAFFSS